MISHNAALPATAPPAGTLVSDAEDEGSVSGDGGITESSIHGPRCPPHHCPAPASVEVFGDDGNMEVEKMETSQQQFQCSQCGQQEEV